MDDHKPECAGQEYKRNGIYDTECKNSSFLCKEDTLWAPVGANNKLASSKMSKLKSLQAEKLTK